MAKRKPGSPKLRHRKKTRKSKRITESLLGPSFFIFFPKCRLLILESSTLGLEVSILILELSTLILELSISVEGMSVGLMSVEPMSVGLMMLSGFPVLYNYAKVSVITG